MKHSTWPWPSPVTTQQCWVCKVKMAARNWPRWRASFSPATACWTPGPSTSPATWTAATITARLRSVARWQPMPRLAAPWAASPPSGSPKRTAVRAPPGVGLPNCHMAHTRQSRFKTIQKWTSRQAHGMAGPQGWGGWKQVFIYFYCSSEFSGWMVSLTQSVLAKLKMALPMHWCHVSKAEVEVHCVALFSQFKPLDAWAFLKIEILQLCHKSMTY